MDNNTYFIYKSPFGDIVIMSDGEAVTCIKPLDNVVPTGIKQATALTDLAAKQLSEYFSEKRKEFDLPLNPKGTDFQRTVWEALQKIPYGEKQTYGFVAQSIGNPKACRAVGLANNRNPIWIVIPCHRVVGANGSLVGYGGGLEMKQKLLDIEEVK